MSKVEKFARIILKRSEIPNLSATTAPSYDHTILPEWQTSDIYTGEFFLNSVDEKLWLRVNETTIKRVLFEGDIVVVSGGTGGIGTSGTSGIDGQNGINGTSGVDGTITGVTTDDTFYYLSGSSMLHVENIEVSNVTVSGLSSDYVVSNIDGELNNSGVLFKTESVPVTYGAITRILHFENGLYIGFNDI